MVKMFLYRIARKANGYVQYVVADGVSNAVQAMVNLEPEEAYLNVWSGPKQRWIEVPESRFAEIYGTTPGDLSRDYRVISSEWEQEGD